MPQEFLTQEDLQKVPHWARVAFAARCVLLVARQLRKFTPPMPANFLAEFHNEVALVGSAGDAVASAAHVGQAPESQLKALRDAIQNREHSLPPPLQSETPDNPLDFGLAAATAAVEAALVSPSDRIRSVMHASSAVQNTFNAFVSYSQMPLDRGGVPDVFRRLTILRDFEQVREAAIQEGWTDTTPVGQSAFDRLMRVYTVRKPGPNTDRDLQAYVDLLEDIGINIADVPRTPEPGTENRWQYVWEDRKHAERFARELGSRLHDPSWQVHEFEIKEEERGPLAPLTIRSMPTPEGIYFRLEPQSQERVMKYFPNAKLGGETKLAEQVMFPSQIRDDYERQHGSVWNQVIIILSGLSEEAIIERLGGVRIVSQKGEVLYERLPAVRQR